VVFSRGSLRAHPTELANHAQDFRVVPGGVLNRFNGMEAGFFMQPQFAQQTGGVTWS
jgi:hypothetical protein